MALERACQELQNGRNPEFLALCYRVKYHDLFITSCLGLNANNKIYVVDLN